MSPDDRLEPLASTVQRFVHAPAEPGQRLVLEFFEHPGSKKAGWKVVRTLD